MDTTNCREVVTLDKGLLAYSICTVVTKPQMYDQMKESFTAAGFNDRCEFLYIDNAVLHQADAYQALNTFLIESTAEIIIFCHQDVLVDEARAVLDLRLRELTALDPNWAICGNAGACDAGSLHVRITDPHGSNTRQGGPFPVKVCSLDENFLILRRKANVTVSRNIGGFHLLGLELCLIAEILGWNAYVIDYLVTHKSKGFPDEKYFAAARLLSEKFSHFFRSRWLVTPTRAQVYVSSSGARRLKARICYRVFGKKRSFKMPN